MMFLRIGVLFAAVWAGAGLAQPLDVYFTESPAEVSSKLAGFCADRSGSILEQDDFHLVCSRTMDGLSGAFAQVLIGNSYSTTPEVRVRFSIIRGPAYVRVVASQWVETQMAGGQVRRQEIDSAKAHYQLLDGLMTIGGLKLPPMTPEEKAQLDRDLASIPDPQPRAK